MTTMHCDMSIQHGRTLFFEQIHNLHGCPAARGMNDSLALLVVNLAMTESWEYTDIASAVKAQTFTLSLAIMTRVLLSGTLHDV